MSRIKAEKLKFRKFEKNNIHLINFNNIDIQAHFSSKILNTKGIQATYNTFFW